MAVKFIAEEKMIYACEECLYTFMRQDGCEQCPDCGKKSIRQATEKVELEYYRNRAECTTEIKRYVLVAMPYSMTPSWYIDPEDKATVGSMVEIDYGVYRDVRGTVMHVIRADINYPPFKGRIKEIREIVELK